ncbi:hypothetical protein NMG60_11009477 [Bertholletia excelsa]
MCSSVTPTSLFAPTAARLHFRRCNFSLLGSSSNPHPIPISRKSISPASCLSASVTERNLEVSWFAPEPNADDTYGGWAIVEAPTARKKKGLRSFLLVGIGTSIAASLAVVSHFSLSRRGLTIKFRSPLHALHGILRQSAPNSVVETETIGYNALPDGTDPEASLESASVAVVETVALETNHLKRQKGKLGRVIIPIAADSTQQEALLILKKLKIVEDDVKADELCTRREYTRWLVRVNSLLERNPKHRIIPTVALSGSLFPAFDDVSIDDPDFEYIQSLAEAGIILSKLAGKNCSGLEDSEGQGGVCFFPQRFISRQDLIDWKAQLEYETMPDMNEKISGTNMGFMDMKEISSDMSSKLFIDMLAGDRGMVRKVFGQGKRFQPNKPSTKAQAAVALTSGRMVEAIHAELSRLDAEDSSRRKAMEDIKSDLLNRGDIQKYWDMKLEEEKAHMFEVERAYHAALYDLEQEKIVQKNTLGEYLKEKAAMDCQRQLLSSLNDEVNEMSERLAIEKVKYEDEQRNLQDTLIEVQAKLEGAHDAKSILEAEIEALQILRSWIEDEAKQSQARAKVLEEVARRWKWDNQR